VIGHVGSRASALVDGQLPPAEAERLWSHVHGCALCRAEVERQGWVKTQLAGLALCRPAEPGSTLRGSLSDVRYGDFDVATRPGESSDRRRMVTLAIVGAGTFGVAMVGVIAMSVPADTPVNDRRNPATTITRPSEPTGGPSRGAGQGQTRLPVRVGVHEWERMTP
jgi:anti-sigma factor RsiW